MYLLVFSFKTKQNGARFSETTTTRNLRENQTPQQQQQQAAARCRMGK